MTVNIPENKQNLQIIDFEKKGNVVRFYLGDASKDYWGDDWDDLPYEHNAGTVYDKFVTGIIDIAFPFDCDVLEPADDWKNNGNSPYSKDDMKARKVPCIIVIKKEEENHYWDNCFSDVFGNDRAITFYFGDSLSVNENGDFLTILKGVKVIQNSETFSL